MLKLTIAIAATFAAMSAIAAEPTLETLPSGVTVQKVRVAEGTQPKSSDTVKVHYRGTLQDGTEFDSSYSRNAPATFPLNRVIPCWTQRRPENEGRGKG